MEQMEQFKTVAIKYLHTIHTELAQAITNLNNFTYQTATPILPYLSQFPQTPVAVPVMRDAEAGVCDIVVWGLGDVDDLIKEGVQKWKEEQIGVVFVVAIKVELGLRWMYAEHICRARSTYRFTNITDAEYIFNAASPQLIETIAQILSHLIQLINDVKQTIADRMEMRLAGAEETVKEWASKSAASML